MQVPTCSPLFFFFNDTATTEIYTLSLHDALPILLTSWPAAPGSSFKNLAASLPRKSWPCAWMSPSKKRSEEHTSELQSQSNLVCRLLLEKKKKRSHRRLRTARSKRSPEPLTPFHI